MSEPTQTCTECGRVEVCYVSGRGFPPDAAKRRLKRRCNAAGCPSRPTYLAGLGFSTAGRVPAADPPACKYGFTEPHKLTDPDAGPYAMPTIPCPHHAEGETDA